MQTSVRVSLVVVQVVTVINTVYGSPTWNNPKGAPPTFVKPMVLPASFARSTLSNELLNILKQSRPNSISPSQPSAPGVSQPATPVAADPSPETAGPTTGSATSPSSPDRPVVPSSVLDKLLNSYDQKSSPTAESKDDLPDTTTVPVFTSTPTDRPDQPSCDSQLDRPPSNFDNCSSLDAVTSRESDENRDLTLTPVMASFMLPTAETPASEQTPRPDVPQTTPAPTPSSAPGTPAANPTSAAGPFPGSTLLPIQPLNLPPKFNQELVKILSDSVRSGSAQELTKNPSPVPSTLPPSLAPPTATSPLLPSCPALVLQPSDPTLPCPGTVSQPSPPVPITPSQQARQILNHLMLNSPSTVQKLKSLVGCYPTPTSNPISASANNPSTPNPCNLNLAFIKYLSTIPRCLNRQ